MALVSRGVSRGAARLQLRRDVLRLEGGVLDAALHGTRGPAHCSALRSGDGITPALNNL
ncbi:hypothetical protein [Salipiger aestuarii]|uniref:hypothetical protein n=1 Tax=Salipiger aestuarii TaxID=568098 RepID=UPI00025B6FC8|nr:hypothetical protein [Salipiger aestuarii]EIE49676.1 hypothetical protein C357_17740 [Citreicella sp. 357]